MQTFLRFHVFFKIILCGLVAKIFFLKIHTQLFHIMEYSKSREKKSHNFSFYQIPTYQLIKLIFKFLCSLFINCEQIRIKPLES